MLEIVCKRFHIYGIIIFTFRKEQNKNLVKTLGFQSLYIFRTKSRRLFSIKSDIVSLYPNIHKDPINTNKSEPC